MKNNMMKQVLDMQKRMQKIQLELDEKTVQASSGGDMVVVTITGNHEIKEIKLSKEVVNPEEMDMLQDLIVAATNEAYRKASEMAQKEMAKVTGGINIPGLDLGSLGM